MSRKLTNAEALRMNALKKTHTGGSHGGRYPKNHDANQEEPCTCSRCFNLREKVAKEKILELKRLRALEEQIKAAGPPIVREPISPGKNRSMVFGHVDREDLETIE